MTMTRRSVMYGSVAASIAAMLPRTFIAQAESSSPTGDQSTDLVSQRLISVSPITSEAETVVLQKLFPGLLDDQEFQKIAPLSFLIRNNSDKGIRAFSSQWSLPSSGEPMTWTTMHYFHPRSSSRSHMHWGLKGNQTKMTGRVPIIKAGGSRLLSPVFNWSPAYYAKQHRPSWSAITKRLAKRPDRFNSLNSLIGHAQVRIVGVIDHAYNAYGQEQASLVRAFRNTRNAEHDEALAVRTMLESGASTEAIRDLLKQHGSGMAFDITPESDLYYRVRQRQAKVLSRRLQYARLDQFERTLAFLANQKETQVRSLSS